MIIFITILPISIFTLKTPLFEYHFFILENLFINRIAATPRKMEVLS